MKSCPTCQDHGFVIETLKNGDRPEHATVPCRDCDEVLIYTCANNGYEDFAPLLIGSALWAGGKNFVEFGVPDLARFQELHADEMEILSQYFPGRFLVNEVEFPTGLSPNSVRLLTHPKTWRTYTYIMDADFIFLDRDFPKKQLEHMRKTGLPYSNSLRPLDKRRLTGLHFTRTSARYPLPEVKMANFGMDEHLLAEQISASGHPFPVDSFRPMPGIHVSVNREIRPRDGKPGWGTISPWFEAYEAFFASPAGEALRPLLRGFALSSVEQVDAHIASRTLHQDAFRKVFAENKWANKESVSGPGSTKSATAELLPQLNEVVDRYGIKSLIDAPCGDFNWIRPLTERVNYVGVDVVPEVIKIARSRGDFKFWVADISSEVLPKRDLILCRDCLVHMTAEMALKVLQNFISSGSAYLLTTTFPDLMKNAPGSLGGWRPINLNVAPFNLPEPLEMIIERPNLPPNEKYGRKALGLWRLNQVAETLALAAREG